MSSADSHKHVTRIICSALFVLAAMAAHGGATGPSDPEEWLKEAEAAYDGVTSYTAVFHKQQRVDGKLLPEETILLKYRKPFSLYLKWIKAPYKGSELLYVAGWNENRIRAHSGGILRFVTRNLDPRDPGLMEGNLRPVTSIGIGYLLKAVATNIRKAIKVRELTFSERGEETVYGRKTQVLEVFFPRRGQRTTTVTGMSSTRMSRARSWSGSEPMSGMTSSSRTTGTRTWTSARHSQPPTSIRKIPSITSERAGTGPRWRAGSCHLATPPGLKVPTPARALP